MSKFRFTQNSRLTNPFCKYCTECLFSMFFFCSHLNTPQSNKVCLLTMGVSAAFRTHTNAVLALPSVGKGHLSTFTSCSLLPFMGAVTSLFRLSALLTSPQVAHSLALNQHICSQLPVLLFYFVFSSSPMAPISCCLSVWGYEAPRWWEDH